MENNNIKQNNQNNSITLSDIVRVIKKNWILICIITVAIFACGAIYTFGVAKPKYKATATVKVELPLDKDAATSEVSSASTTALKYIETVSQTVKLPIVVDAVAKRHEDIITASKLSSEISTTTSSNSYLVKITVTDRSGDNAVTLVNDLATEISKYSKNASDASVPEENRYQCSISTLNPASGSSYASPNKKLYLIVSLLGGLVVAAVVVFIKEFASTKYQNADEIEGLGYPVLNTLVDDKTKEKNEDSLLIPSVKNFEPYNRLISNIKFSNVDNPYKVVMFTSSIMEELKTTVCSNFAYTLAHNEKKVLIIDLDTRKPRIHKTFGTSKENGVVEYLDGQIDKETLIKKTDKNVDIITVGKEVVNPITLLESDKLKELIDELKNDYDYIAIDTPPLTACNDAAIISKLADAVVFNIAINQGKKKEIKASLHQLQEAKANVIGINITKANIKDRNNYYYYYYEYGDKTEAKTTETK